MKGFLKYLKSVLWWYVPLTLVSIFVEYIFTWNGCTLEEAKQWAFYNAYFGISFSTVNAFYHNNVDKLYPWKSTTRLNLLIRIVGAIIVNVILAIVLMAILKGPIEGGRLMDAFDPRYKDTYLICFVLLIFFTSLTYAIAFYREVANERIEKEKILREKSITELNALKTQVDPHFLFNSFNVLSGLIDESPDKAQKFLSKLSGIYRYVLENREEDLIALDDEMAFANKYMQLQKIRFGDNISLDVDLTSEAYAKKLPSLSLQMVLENAIKHNGFDDKNPLRIKIRNQNGHLVISNNKLKRENLSSSNGIGLSNIRSRYELYGREDFKVSDEVNEFSVNLPLI